MESNFMRNFMRIFMKHNKHDTYQLKTDVVEVRMDVGEAIVVGTPPRIASAA